MTLVAGQLFGAELTEPAALAEVNPELASVAELDADSELFLSRPDSIGATYKLDSSDGCYDLHDPWAEDVDRLELTAGTAPMMFEPKLTESVVPPFKRWQPPVQLIPLLMLKDEEPMSPTAIWTKEAWLKTAAGTRDWTKRFTLGMRYVTGNSHERTANVQADFERIGTSNNTQVQIGGQFGESNGVRGSNRWFATGTSDFNTPSNWIYFLKHMNEYDEFQNLDYRGTYSGGMGYRFFNADKRRLIVRFGPAGTLEYFHAPATDRLTMDLFAEFEAQWPITKRVQYDQKTTVYPNVQNFELFRTTTTANLVIALDEGERWALQVGVQDQYISQPNTNRLPHDLWTNVSIVYQRK